MGPLLGMLNAENKTIDEANVSAEYLADLLLMIEDGTISGKIAKERKKGISKRWIFI